MATPSQSQTFPPAGPSGSNTPRTASYAGAVKSQNNFHLEFYLDGKRVGLHETIYGLVHKMEKQKGDADRSGMLAGFGGTVTFRFRKVDGPAPLEGDSHLSQVDWRLISLQLLQLTPRLLDRSSALCQPAWIPRALLSRFCDCFAWFTTSLSMGERLLDETPLTWTRVSSSITSSRLN